MIKTKDAIDVKKKLDSIRFDGSYGEIYVKDGMIYIEEVEGDWKHTHNALDNMLKEMGYEVFDEPIKVEDPDVINDWYTSDHIYVREDK